jgi:hypothetical protein
MSGALSFSIGILKAPSGGGGGGGAYATGGTVVDISGYRVHIFNSSDTFATTSSWPSGRTIEYLVVAGGGGGDDGGGGAGGLLSASGVTGIATTNYAVTVGAGGTTGTNGANSSIIGGAISVTSVGGGGGGDAADSYNGKNGGSGGGGGVGNGDGNGGIGVYPGSTYIDAPRQGYDGSFASGGKYPDSGNGGGAGGPGGFAGGPGLVSDMLSFYSSSTITIAAYNFDWTEYTFSVSSGLPFQTDASVYVENSSDPTKALFGRVVSYSDTTLVCRLDRFETDNNEYTLSGWNIKFDHAGGGRGYIDGGYSPPPIGGGGGDVGYGVEYNIQGAPNSGGGGFYSSGDENGGSGVVMIKYAYP